MTGYKEEVQEAWLRLEADGTDPIKVLLYKLQKMTKALRPGADPRLATQSYKYI